MTAAVKETAICNVNHTLHKLVQYVSITAIVNLRV